VDQDIRRRRGGQPGNRNACKHGYYSSALTGIDRANLTQAAQIAGLDEEIALLRSRLKALIQRDPDNLHLISEITSALSRLMRTSQKCAFNKDEEFQRNRWNVLYSLGTQFGLNLDYLAGKFLGLKDSQLEDISRHNVGDAGLNESPKKPDLATQ
jgi:hypothetical protein